MQITLLRSELKQAVAGLSRVVPRRATLPVLQMIRLSAGGGRITATGTDLDQTLSYRFAHATAQGEGAFLVGLADLQLLAKGADGEVGLKAVSASDIEITNPVGGQAISRSVTTEDPKEWPGPFPTVEAGPVDPAFLANFRRVATTASHDESRRVLTGVYLDIGKEGDYLVGCDGRRLCTANTIKLPFKESCIVPASKFMTWTKLDAEELLIGHSQPKDAGWFRLVTPLFDYQARTIEGTYPNWRQVVPSEDGPHSLAISNEDAALLTKVLPTFAGHDTHNAGITLAAESGKLIAQGQGTDDKQPSRLDLTTSTSQGGTARTTVDRRFLMDALQAGFRAFTFQDSESPLLARDGQGGVHVLMPMRSGTGPAPKVPPVTESAPVGTSQRSEPTTTVINKKEEKRMSKTSESPVQPQGTALERVLAAYEMAKTKVREANEALAIIAVAVKDALKEDKQRRQEVESVRAGLARLQAIKV